MTNKNKIYASITYAFLFVIFFHHQDLGLNILLWEGLILIWLAISKQIEWRNKNHIIFGGGLFLTAIATVAVYSDYVIAINILAFFMFTGLLIYPKAKSAETGVRLAFHNFYASQAIFFAALSRPESERNSKLRILKKASVFVIPLVIIVFFIILYRGSSPFFDRFVENIILFLQTYIFSIFEHLDLTTVFTFTIGLAFANTIFFRFYRRSIIEADLNSGDDLIRIKREGNFSYSGLKDECKAGIFLLVILNLILLVVNALDVYWVWFNFSWNGQYLKQFVHEGTYLLLLSILCSIVIVLYFFRGNLNFYSGSKLLRYLSYVWLVQNAVLTVSVGVRNFHYIHYFALAYKRIGLLLFLMLTLYGFFTVYRKVSQRKSAFYLFRTNILAMYVILMGSSLINWESIIARYNFEHYQTAFVELRYLSTFPNKTLPYLDKQEAELTKIKNLQHSMFPFVQNDMKESDYRLTIEQHKQQFKREWEAKTILSWNLPEYLAYQKFSQP